MISSKPTSGKEGIVITDLEGAQTSDALINIERIYFDHLRVAFDADGPGGQAYRLYQAAFDRTPDPAGLGNLIEALDAGTSLNVVASAFVASAEWHALYEQALNNAGIVQRMYANVLHRVPDASGAAFWTGILESHGASLGAGAGGV